MYFRLKLWRVIEVDGGTYHLVGFAENAEDNYAKGRISSAVRSFDPATMMATTRSGNHYELVGPKGCDIEASWVLDHWLWWNSARIVGDDCDLAVLVRTRQ